MIKTLETSDYPAETVGTRMSTNVPVYTQDTRFHTIVEDLFTRHWDSIRAIYIVDEQGKLVGVVDIAQTQNIRETARLADIMSDPTATLRPHADQEKAVFLAIRDNVASIPVTDKHDQLLGAVTGHAIIDIMHEEHIEDAMLTAGVRSGQANIVKLASDRIRLVVRSRAPWLVAGLLIGMGLGLITSFFEQTLEASIALAFFIPVIAYIADSVGTQSSTITVRALATMKLNHGKYILREFTVGVCLGIIMGILGALGALIISQSADVALVVGLTLLSASTIASVLASVVPMTLRALGKDPALGSGPLATALQDILSLLIYFLFAMWIIGG